MGYLCTCIISNSKISALNSFYGWFQFCFPLSPRQVNKTSGHIFSLYLILLITLIYNLSSLVGTRNHVEPALNLIVILPCLNMAKLTGTNSGHRFFFSLRCQWRSHFMSIKQHVSVLCMGTLTLYHASWLFSRADNQLVFHMSFVPFKNKIEQIRTNLKGWISSQNGN